MYPYGFFWGDPTIILLIPAIILSLYAQSKVSGTFRRFSRVRSRYGHTGSEVARRLLDMNGLHDVRIERIGGHLTDHYDPRTRVLRLSDSVFGSSSIASIGVAAHETGHAVQHSTGYLPLVARNVIAPVAGFGSRMAWMLILVGFIWPATGFLEIGIIFFLAVVVFQLITLPVEFNASSRAIAMLGDSGLVAGEELVPARKVLNAAALTYVAAAVTGLIQLLRLVLLASRRE